MADLHLAVDLQPERAVLATVDADGIADVRRVERLRADDAWAGTAQLADAVAVLAERAPEPLASLTVAAAAGTLQAGEITRMLTERTRLPGRLVARGMALAWAEGLAGAAQGVQDFAYLRLSDRLEGGVVVQGRPWHRALDLAHLPVDPLGPLCPCGARGCLERYAGAAALDTLARDLDVPRNQPAATDLGVHAELAWRAAAGERQVLAVVAEAARALGIALANVARTLDLGTVVLASGQRGGTVAVLPRVQAVLARQAGRQVRLVAASLGEEGVLLGAARWP